MGKILREAARGNYAFWICLVVAIVLIVGGAITPPPFVIDSSIFIGVGELFAFAALGTLGVAIEKGLDAKVTHGDTTIEVNNNDDKEGD